MKADLVVVGAGPAGLMAAGTAAQHGAKVIVIDENAHVGGKLPGQLHEAPGHGWWIGSQVARELHDQAIEAGVDILLQREVWGIFPGFSVMLDQQEEIEANYVLLATGAVERPIPMPGWTLPGVMAVGAAQVLTNIHRVLPGKRVLVVGVDVLSLTIARQLALAGAEVSGIVLPPPGVFSGARAVPWEMISQLSSMADLAPTAWLRTAGKFARGAFVQQIGASFYPKKGLRVWGIPLMLRKAALEIKGNEQVEKVLIAQLSPEGEVIQGSEEEIAVDSVCISGGLTPLAEMASAIGCQLAYVPELGGHVPVHSEELATSVGNLYVAGNITGVEGAKVAQAQGKLAGIVIAAKLQLLQEEKECIDSAKQELETIRNRAEFHFLADIHRGREKMKELWQHYRQQEQVGQDQVHQEAEEKSYANS